MQKLLVGLLSCLLLSLTFLLLNWCNYLSVFEVDTFTVVAPEPYVMDKQTAQAQIKVPTLLFGIATNSFLVINETIKAGQSLSHILQNYTREWNVS